MKGESHVLGIPIPKTQVIWAFPSHTTLAIWVRVKVAEHSLAVCEYMSFAKLWQEKGCSLQAETWQVKNILMKDFD